MVEPNHHDLILQLGLVSKNHPKEEKKMNNKINESTTFESFFVLYSKFKMCTRGLCLLFVRLKGLHKSKEN